MQIIKNQSFGGERPLFGLRQTRLENITVTDGESGIKHCEDIEAVGCTFIGKYPFWHVDRSLIKDCLFEPGARSAIWYSDDMRVEHTTINAPKLFREQRNLEIVDTVINDADETFWKIRGLKVHNLKLHDGTYPFMFSEDIYIDGLESDAKYVFQYVKNVEIHHAKITTKDAFWEVENVTVYDSELHGEYLGWHSKNLRLVNCHLSGEQLLCYADNLVLENCTFDPACDRLFEYSTLQADIRGDVTNIKNPTSGHIVADSIGSVTIDEHVRQPNNCVIETRS